MGGRWTDDKDESIADFVRREREQVRQRRRRSRLRSVLGFFVTVGLELFSGGGCFFLRVRGRGWFGSHVRTGGYVFFVYVFLMVLWGARILGLIDRLCLFCFHIFLARCCLQVLALPFTVMLVKRGRKASQRGFVFFAREPRSVAVGVGVWRACHKKCDH